MIHAILLLVGVSSAGIAADDDVGIPVSGGGDNIVGEFSISPAVNDVVVSNGGESLTSHSGIIMAEATQGGGTDSGASTDGDGIDDAIYDDKTDVKTNEGTGGNDIDNPLQWWTKSNVVKNLHFMSTLNPS